MSIEEIFGYIGENADRYISFLARICSFEADAYDKKTLDEMSDYISDFAIGEGFSVRRTPFSECGDFLSIEMNVGQERGALFMAHMDTVHDKGAFGSPAVRIEGEVMKAPGATDCKGGIAIALLTMKALSVAGYKKHLRLILTSDEEVSNVLGGEREIAFFTEESRGFPYALNCETAEGNSVVTARKGIMRFDIAVKGVGGHSGKHYFQTSNPILECANKIVALQSESREGGITYSCNIFNAGTAINVIPDTASFSVDVRFPLTEDIEIARGTVERICAKSFVPGTSAEVILRSVRPPMQPDERTDELFLRLDAVSREYGLGELTAVYSGGGSDSAYTQAAGVVSICGLGGSGGFCHTVREYMNLSSLAQRAKMLSAFLVKE